MLIESADDGFLMTVIGETNSQSRAADGPLNTYTIYSRIEIIWNVDKKTHRFNFQIFSTNS